MQNEENCNTLKLQLFRFAQTHQSDMKLNSRKKRDWVSIFVCFIENCFIPNKYLLREEYWIAYFCWKWSFGPLNFFPIFPIKVSFFQVDLFTFSWTKKDKNKLTFCTLLIKMEVIKYKF